LYFVNIFKQMQIQRIFETANGATVFKLIYIPIKTMKKRNEPESVVMCEAALGREGDRYYPTRQTSTSRANSVLTQQVGVLLIFSQNEILKRFLFDVLLISIF
jgi:hypothetical protein